MVDDANILESQNQQNNTNCLHSLSYVANLYFVTLYFVFDVNLDFVQ